MQIQTSLSVDRVAELLKPEKFDWADEFSDDDEPESIVVNIPAVEEAAYSHQSSSLSPNDHFDAQCTIDAEFDYREQFIVNDQDVHHFNWYGQPVYEHSSTPPIVSLWYMTSDPKAPRPADEMRRRSVMNRAIAYIDPVMLSPDQEANSKDGLAVDDAFKCYSAHGTWMSDPREKDDMTVLDHGNMEAYSTSHNIVANGIVQTPFIPTRIEREQMKNEVFANASAFRDKQLHDKQKHAKSATPLRNCIRANEPMIDEMTTKEHKKLEAVIVSQVSEALSHDSLTKPTESRCDINTSFDEDAHSSDGCLEDEDTGCDMTRQQSALDFHKKQDSHSVDEVDHIELSWRDTAFWRCDEPTTLSYVCLAPPTNTLETVMEEDAEVEPYIPSTPESCHNELSSNAGSSLWSSAGEEETPRSSIEVSSLQASQTDETAPDTDQSHQRQNGGRLTNTLRKLSASARSIAVRSKRASGTSSLNRELDEVQAHTSEVHADEPNVSLQPHNPSSKDKGPMSRIWTCVRSAKVMCEWDLRSTRRKIKQKLAPEKRARSREGKWSSSKK